MSSYRLPQTAPSNAIINRQKNLFFTFDGKQYAGLEGDTLASALSANDVKLLARSFKYHRPRGLFGTGGEEPNALLTIGNGASAEVNLPATMVSLIDGLDATSQNRWPCLRFDVAAINGFAGTLLSAGFYYKTFMGPASDAWKLYEPFIRKAAGMGKAGHEADPDRYEHAHGYCDVLVVGSGPAGLAAARQAANAGASVFLCEEQPYFGGSLLGDFSSIKGVSTTEWTTNQVDDLKDISRVTLLPRTCVYGAFDGMTFAALETLNSNNLRARHWTIRTKQVILATGANDRPIVFPGNDLPGVMLLDAVRTKALKFGVAMGHKVSVFANHDGAYGSIHDLARAGVKIDHVIDPRTDIDMEKAELVRSIGADLIKGSVVCGTSGRLALKSIRVAKWDGRNIQGGAFGLECDCLAVSGGVTPLIQLASQSGSKPLWNETFGAFLMAKKFADAWYVAGAANADFGLGDAIDAGTNAGSAAAKALNLSTKRGRAVSITNLGFGYEPKRIQPITEVPNSSHGSKQEAFVDLQHDVTADDIRLAHSEGFKAAEHLKRYTTLGMAGDQGKTSNINGMAIMADQLGTPIEEVGTTRFRPPYRPITLGAVAGESIGSHLRPTRKTPMHDWHVANGAEMMDVGLWKRPRVYYRAGETLDEAYIREARAVRQSVGIVDVSTLGKIDVQGPDAATLLDRIYTNDLSSLPVGRARYGLMLRQDGLLFDDGTVWRTSDMRYLVTTTTAQARAVFTQMEYYLATWWPDLKVKITSVTDHWGAMALSGPNARRTLQKITKEDVSHPTLPFMGVREIELDDVRCLVSRLSFSGELAYEIFCPAHKAEHVWRALINAGAEFDITAYGLESLGTLRIEKGHVAGGELDGRITADDAGLSGLCSDKKFYVGKALMSREDLVRGGRLQVVGLIADGDFALSGGAHLVSNDTLSEPAESEGHVSSATYSPALEKYIALGLLGNGRQRIGEAIYVSDPLSGSHRKARVVDKVFYDSGGEKMRG